MIIKGSCRDFRFIEKSSRDPLMFNSNIVRGMRLKHTWSLTFYGGRFIKFIIYFWTRESPKLVKCGIHAKEAPEVGYENMVFSRCHFTICA
jgi:hypothetical protein